MFDWIKRFFMTRWGGHCPLCGSSRVSIKIRRKSPLRGRRPDVCVLHMSGVSPRMELPDPSRHLRAEGHSNAR